MAASRQPGSPTGTNKAVTVSTQTERLGKYEIVKHIATGGMAEIHLARATGIEGFEKWVVLKRILPQFSTNSEFVQMFLDEARIAATLHHPNIVQVYDIGSVRGQYFFAMEFLQGEDVRRIMEATISAGREMPIEHAVNIILGVCNGLHYAHDKAGIHGEPLNLVHRDVSPQNIFVTYDGGVKLVDFGIAKASNRLTETRQGTLKGKLSYMSPEQCKGEGIDRRSDVFALAIMLWELTTSKRLFRGPSEFEIMKMVIETDAPLPSSVRPGYSPDLERIVMKGLARNPEQRYQSVQEMQIDLEEFAREYKLATSSMNLSRFMREMFSAKINEWASAVREGKFTAESTNPPKPATAAQPIVVVTPTPNHPSLDASFVSAVTPMRERESQVDSMIVSRSSTGKTIAITTASVAMALALVVGAVWQGQAGKHASSVEVVDTPSTPPTTPTQQAAAQLSPKADLHASAQPSKSHTNVVARRPEKIEKVEVKAPPVAEGPPTTTAPHAAHARLEDIVPEKKTVDVERHLAHETAPTPSRSRHEAAAPTPTPTKVEKKPPTSWDPNSAEMPE